MKSLRARLHLGLTLSLAAIVAAAWSIGQETLRGTAESFIQSRLRQDAEALVGALDFGPGGELKLRGGRVTPVYRQPYSGYYFAVETVGGARLGSRSLWDRELRMQPLAVGETVTWRTEGPVGQRLLVWSGGYRRDDIAFTLAVAEDITAVEQNLATYERWMLFSAAAGFALVILLQRLVVWRAFMRLRAVYGDIERLETGQTGYLSEEVPAEIRPLVGKINGLLTIYAKRLERSRQAVGNLAHAFKRPLGLMLRQLQDARVDPALRASLKKQIGHLDRLMKRELKRARLAGDGGPGLRFDATAELPALTRLLELMYEGKGLSIASRIEIQGDLAADREDMLELLGNLLDNACKWGRSRVRCTLAPHGEGVWFQVEDDGPGCSETEIASLGIRGVRLDERVNGHGLGLSIVREIAALYSGCVDLGRSDDLGGFCVTVRLPFKTVSGTG